MTDTGTPPPEPEPDAATRGALARFVRRAVAAGVPVAVVDLLGPGRRFTPSRGDVGAWYRPDEIAVRELGSSGAGGLAAGLALYPPPGPDVGRVIVLPMERGNWLAHADSLERTLAELVDAEERSRDGGPE